MNGNTTFVENARILMMKGEPGSSIQSITKTGTSGAVDTYTITMTDGNTSTFTVTNGTPIQSIELTSSDDEYDYYTLTDSAGNTATFKVQNHDKDITDFENEINALLDNTPYLYYVEDEDFELPVNTINDNDTSDESTWSSAHISDVVNGAISYNNEYIESYLFYKIGDTVNGGSNSMYAGMIFNQATTINVLVPLNRPVKNDVSGIVIGDNSRITVRETDGTSVVNYQIIKDISNITVKSISDLGVSLTFTKKTGKWSTAETNHMVEVQFDGTFTMTFT